MPLSTNLTGETLFFQEYCRISLDPLLSSNVRVVPLVERPLNTPRADRIVKVSTNNERTRTLTIAGQSVGGSIATRSSEGHDIQLIQGPTYRRSYQNRECFETKIEGNTYASEAKDYSQDELPLVQYQLPSGKSSRQRVELASLWTINRAQERELQTGVNNLLISHAYRYRNVLHRVVVQFPGHLQQPESFIQENTWKFEQSGRNPTLESISTVVVSDGVLGNAHPPQASITGESD
jgi:hypothetical protein